MQSGARQRSFKTPANNFGVVRAFVHSPRTRVRFYSSPDTTGFLTVVETPLRNCCAVQELSAEWNHGVSRCHSPFRRRLGDLKCRKCAPGRLRRSRVKFRQLCVKCGAGDSESGSLWRVSPGPSPALSPHWLSATAALWQGLQIFRLLAASFNSATATPTYTPGSA